MTGWQVTALRSGQLAGLSVPPAALKGAEKWLDAVMDRTTFGYGANAPKAAPAPTAVGLLCRQHLGWAPLRPELAKGIDYLGQVPLEKAGGAQHLYHATQVMHHAGGDLGPAWTRKVRDLLLAKQDMGKDPKHPHQKGSWSPEGDAHAAQGGRLMVTSLSLLTLEVYYRHLPLYRRELAAP